ncbi:MAG: hypothetical protein AB7N80_11245 [Bdellovibrionales bacterium]
MRTQIWLGACLLAVLIASTGCGEDTASFSILPDGDTFQQNTQSSNTEIDILWVVDNSGSMATSQSNLANNFPNFIEGFADRNLDFQMGVAATDNYIALPTMTSIYNSLPSNHYLKAQAQNTWSRFRDGYTSHSGVFVMNELTPNLASTFLTNVSLGVTGLGDERMFQSMKVALDSTLNAGFLRAESFLAVIILTDEDDFSHDGTNYLDGQYSNTNLHTVASYKQHLDTLTGSTDTRRRYNVHSIAIQDVACRDSLGAGRRIATRVNQLADLTGGTRFSLCGNFATGLSLIADNILELSTQFYLSRIPIESTIAVKINGVDVPNVSTSPGNGWYYNAVANSIMFQGTAVPPQGSSISVNFDPVSLGG